jgi:carboxymethylenebutenolidase
MTTSDSPASGTTHSSAAATQRTVTINTTTLSSITLQAADGHRLSGLLGRPAGAHADAPLGGLVITHDAFGMSRYARSVCERWAGAGFLTLVPALYDRQQAGAGFDDVEQHPARMAAARALRGGLAWDSVLQDVAAAADWLRQEGKVSKVGILGFCVGGSVVWLSAARLALDAAVAYYPSDILSLTDCQPRCPIQLHFGQHDSLIPIDGVRALLAQRPELPAFEYPSGHGFDGPSTRHDAAASALAGERALAFLRARLA